MHSRTQFSFASLVLLVASATSCGSKDAVAVSGAIHNPQVTVSKSQLVTNMTGQFDVRVELGARASGPTDVTFNEFALLRASDGAPVLASEKIGVLPSVDGPVHLGPGDTATVQFKIADERNGLAAPLELGAQDYDAVCGAGELIISGTMTDSAQGAATTPLTSAPFLPSGC